MKRIFIIFFVILFFNGCFLRKQELSVNFDNSDPLALAPDVSWAVITDPYAAFRENAGWESGVTGHCRRGEIYQISGSDAVRNSTSSDIWYLFKEGWLPASAVAVLPNKFSAQTMANSLK